MIDYDRKIILIHPPRCGGTTVEKTLYGKDYFLIDKDLKHKSISEYITKIKNNKYNIEDFVWYGLIRNPFDRLLSMYNTRYWHNTIINNKHMNFLKFCSLVMPATHESKNLKLVDYYDVDIPVNIYSQDNVNKLIYDIDKNVEIKSAEVKSYKKPIFMIRYIAMGIILIRFKEDFNRFKFKYNKFILLILPVSFIIYNIYKISKKRCHLKYP